MEIILKKDMPQLGEKDDILTVKNGYAVNYLIPKGYATKATESAKKVLAENQRQQAHKAAKLRKEAEELADKIKNKTFKVGAKTSTTGKIFGSVNTIQIAEMLAKKGFDIDRKKIIIPENIKEVGTYTATIKLLKGIKLDFEFDVISE